MTTSTINPTIPVANSSLSSAPIRANFLAAYTDINNLWNAITSSGVSSVNSLIGAVTFAAGTNITLTPAGNTITISAASGSSTGQTITNSYSFSINPAIFTTNIANITPGAVAISVDPTTLTPWAMYIVQDAGGNAGANNITITPASGTFQLQTNYVIFQDTGGVKFYSDGTNIWVSP